jgi:hypothetical protein
MPRRGVGVLADDQNPYVLERLLESSQDVRTGRQIPAARGHLGTQELTHRPDPIGDRFQCSGPAGLDGLTQRTSCHVLQL